MFGRSSRRRRVVVLDLETKRGPDEVRGGWKNARSMGASVVGVYHYHGRRFESYRSDQPGRFDELATSLQAADLVIGFNLIGFDLQVLAGALRGDWVTELPALDLLVLVQEALGHRLRLDDLAHATLGREKSGHGKEALELYRRGDWQRLERYCLEDVRITRDLYEFAKRRGFLRYYRRGRRVKVRVQV